MCKAIHILVRLSCSGMHELVILCVLVKFYFVCTFGDFVVYMYIYIYMESLYVLRLLLKYDFIKKVII